MAIEKTFHVVAHTSELPNDGAQMHIELNGEEILLCRHEGNYHAIAYFCSHEAFTLEGGSIHNNCITCPYHGAEFSIIDGSVQAAPAWDPIRIYAIQLNDDDTIAISTDDDD